MKDYRVTMTLQKDVTFKTLRFDHWVPKDVEIDAKFVKKLSKLGSPEIWVYYGEDGSESQLLSPDREKNQITAMFDLETQKIDVSLSGSFEFLAFDEPSNLKSLQNAKSFLIKGVSLNNDKQKPIKLPKDSYGMSLPLQIPVSENDEEGVEVFFDVTISAA